MVSSLWQMSTYEVVRLADSRAAANLLRPSEVMNSLELKLAV
jgi:hypothetical protein